MHQGLNISNKYYSAKVDILVVDILGEGYELPRLPDSCKVDASIAVVGRTDDVTQLCTWTKNIATTHAPDLQIVVELDRGSAPGERMAGFAS